VPESVPVAFVRDGRGWLGGGTIERATLPARDAYRRAAKWWRREARERRRAGMESIVAFGAFPFDARSPAGATLIVPEWATPIDGALPRLGASALPQASVREGAMSRARYLSAVDQVRTAIGAGRLEKAVLARDVVIEHDGPADLGTVVDRLAGAHPGASVFSVDGLVGASPETLLAVHGGVVTARVLAGTAGPAEADALLASDKDLREHALAATSVLDALAPHVRGLETTDPYVLELPHLTHLATDVTAEVSDGSGVLELVAALHPTAAVAGVPQRTALNWIHELEPLDRGRYAGPVGWVDDAGDGEWAIALRCAQLQPDGTFRAFAGAGIMADSVPELELAETDLKLRPILEALGAVR